MNIKKISAYLSIPALAFSLAACGGDDKSSHSKVSKEQFVEGYGDVIFKQGNGVITKEMSTEIADCVYEKIDGKVDDDVYEAIAKKDLSYKGSAEDRKILVDASATCGQKVGMEHAQQQPTN